MAASRYGRGKHIANPCPACGKPFGDREKIVLVKLATVYGGSYELASRPPVVVLHEDCFGK